MVCYRRIPIGRVYFDHSALRKEKWFWAPQLYPSLSGCALTREEALEFVRQAALKPREDFDFEAQLIEARDREEAFQQREASYKRRR